MEATQEQTQLEQMIDERIKSAIAEEQTRTNRRFRRVSETKIYGLLVVCFLLFGSVGGHRIYAGQWVSGLFMFLAASAIGGIHLYSESFPRPVWLIAVAGLLLWELLDLIMILTKQFKDARGVTIG